jgi:hypothetical protein
MKMYFHKKKRLLKPLTARVRGGQKNGVVKHFHLARDVVSFFQENGLTLRFGSPAGAFQNAQ